MKKPGDTDHLKVLGSEPAPMRDIDALRERAAFALEKALGFVDAHGNELSRLRARILVELDTVESGIDWLTQMQAEDGSLPPLGQVFPGPITRDLRNLDAEGKVSGSLEALSVLSDWQHLYDATCDRIVDYLFRVQNEDGGYGEPADTLAEPTVRVFATGLIAGFLGRTRSARPETMTSAGRFMNGFWSVDYIRKNGWPAVAAFAHYFTNVHDDEGEAALPWCSRELERGGLVGEYSACQQLRVLFYCEADALPGVEFNTNALLDQMLNEQREDGSCPATVGADEQPEERVASTLDGMLFILRLCRAEGQ